MSRLIRNSTWEVISEKGLLEKGLYRILGIFANMDLMILFPLDKKSQMKRPFAVSMSSIEEEKTNKWFVNKEYKLPESKLLGEDEIPINWKIKRDHKYSLIAPLVEDESFLYQLVIKKRSGTIKLRAKEININDLSIYRALHEYWRYGQNINSLIPIYEKCGGLGVQKKIKSGIRGKPKNQSIYDFKERNITVVTEEEKNKIRKSIKKFFVKEKTKTIVRVYEKHLDKYHKSEVENASLNDRAPDVISIYQFRYWFNKLNDEICNDKKRTGEVSWEMNKRGLLSSVSEHICAPGDRYQIDATTADVYVVSKYNRSRVLGRPVIYVVVDEASRMVVGLFIGLVYASWDAAKQALLNAFLPKKEFCARYGIEIEDEEWPCYNIPRRLLCDRGEMIGNAPEEHLTPMGINLEFAAPTRADWKAVVERRFGIANDETLHELKGTTYGKPKLRMDPDPKTKALHTLDEVIQILIKGFIGFNKTRHIDALIIPGLIAEDLAPTPLNFWNYHVTKQLDSLSIVDEIQARAELMRAERGSITIRGIRVGDLYYSCKIAEEEDWFALARIRGEWSVDARIDDTNSSEVYIRKDIRSPLIRCEILPREKLYADLHHAEVIWISEWKREKKETGENLSSRLRQVNEIEKINKVAVKDRKETIGGFKKTPNDVSNLRVAKVNEKIISEDREDSNVNNAKNTPHVDDEYINSKLALIEEVLNGDEN